MMKRVSVGLLLGLGCAAACGSVTEDAPPGMNGDAGSAGETSGDVNSGGETSLPSGAIVVSAAAPRARQTTWSVNYWTWSPSLVDHVAGTETQIAALKPDILRVGGENNDAKTPDPFDDAQLDKTVAYAKAIGARPLIQMPLLADVGGGAPTAASAAVLVKYANVTKGYGIKYFSIGNEPDLYASQSLPSDMSLPAIPNYPPAAYCASARAYVKAMKAVDPKIEIVGPDLAYRYQPGIDWLTPILEDCGDLFDVVSIHRYPFSAKHATQQPPVLLGLIVEILLGDAEHDGLADGACRVAGQRVTERSRPTYEIPGAMDQP